MADREVQRRLAAILAADVAGYTRLMEEDTDGTVAAWQNAREDIIKPQIDTHSGRIVKLTGDGFLVEFPTVRDAVKCAITMQEDLLSNSLNFRMGVNLGDIVDDGEDIHGEGVNVAARLEGLAEPGGICISGEAHALVRNQVVYGFKDLGDQEVKHVTYPVRVYAILKADDEVAGILTSARNDKPSIAVLPFDNLSGDPEQEYFSDGITEDIITGLSRWRSFPVIARNSSFAYRGASQDIRKIGSELGAHYLLEGSTRKAGKRIRITAQLIDVTTGHHVWAEKYDRELTDIFDLQDEITQRIAATVVPELDKVEQKRAGAKHTSNLDSWDFYLRGLSFIHKYTKEGNVQARELFERAIELDPEYAPTWSAIVLSHGSDMLLGFTDNPKDTIAKAVAAAEQAVALDDSDSVAHLYFSIAHTWAERDDLAIVEGEKAITLNPSNSYAYGHLGNVLDLVGRADEGIAMMEQGLHLNPQDPLNHTTISFIARAYLNARRYEEAADWARKTISSHSKYANAHYILAISLSHLKQFDEACAMLQECERIQPGFVQARSSWQPYRNEADNEHILDGLRNSGWEDKSTPPSQTDKPSIAVLPFNNISSDLEQEYFSDGITEDIITDLSKVSGLFVIARNSSFVYKNKTINVAEVCHELGVKFAVEGSVRKAGNRIRITAQLINGDTGGHLWAERYDRVLEDIFAIQDEITRNIVEALKVELNLDEQARIGGPATTSVEAYDFALRAREMLLRHVREDNAEAAILYERSIKLDPDFITAHAELALTLYTSYLNGWNDDSEATLQRGLRLASRATELDPSDPHGHWALAYGRLWNCDLAGALKAVERAIAVGPNYAEAYATRGNILSYASRPAEAIESLKTSMRLDPQHPRIWLHFLAHAHFIGGDYKEAASLLKRRIRLQPETDISRVLLASCQGHLGLDADARNEWAEVLRINPGYSVERKARILPYKNPADWDRFMEGLRKAGVPES